MTPDELTAKYLLARILYWRDQLDGLDGAAVAQLIKVLSSAKADVLARLKADMDGIASVTDWNRDRLRQVNAWISEVTAGAQATALTTITQSSITAATASLATYNAMLSFEGKASAVKTVGMTTEQPRTSTTQPSPIFQLGSAALLLVLSWRCDSPPLKLNCTLY